jgi:hypothetical protein
MLGSTPVLALLMRANIKITSALAALLSFTVGLLAHQTARAEHRDFCGSVPSECEYTGPWAPVLAANVCWSRTTSTATLMTGATCPTGSWPYFVKYGLVDALSLHVSAFIPLDDACSRPNICQPGALAPPNTTEEPICCPGDCWPAESAQCAGQELYMCVYGASNDDGTVTCFDDELLD